MIKTYIRVELSSEGESPKQIIERMRRMGAVPIVGDYDFEMDLDDDERLFDKLEEIHLALKGSSVRYTLTTRTDAEAASVAKSRHEVTHYVDQKPIELKKSLYKAKLERWRDMGLDVSELEELLETDLSHFKAASKEFLRTHLNHMSVVKDRRVPDNQVDGEILALLDETGRSLSQIMSATGYSEDTVTLSLGRLISSESARRVKRDSVEIFCLIPPPAPPVRKALQVVPAMDQSEAEERVYAAINPDGISSKDLVRAARLPREQLSKAVAILIKKGRIRKELKAKKDFYSRT
jgi:hypothetical protein